MARPARPSVPAASGRAATLYVVATPIGNLEDITLRALRTLREVDVVAAEDTRRTGNLLRHYEIPTPLLSLHEHNEVERIPKVLDRLRSGQSVAVVSDAGTPAISDPGAALVRAARAEGFPVVPVPGASAVTAAISVSGLDDTPFAFWGFPPVRSNSRKKWLAQVVAHREAANVLFEAPHRIQQTLDELAVLLVERPIILGREVTKLHEEWFTGPASAVRANLREPQGEFVLVIPPGPAPAAVNGVISDREIFTLFGQITENTQGDRREVVRQVAEQTKLSAREVYAAIERAKKLVE